MCGSPKIIIDNDMNIISIDDKVIGLFRNIYGKDVKVGESIPQLLDNIPSDPFSIIKEIDNLKKEDYSHLQNFKITFIKNDNNTFCGYMDYHCDRESREIRDKFLATMSHGIRTPLNGIIGMARVMENTNLSDEQTGYMEIINQCGYQLLEIINDILDYSKMTSHKLTLHPDTFEIKKCIEDSFDTILIKSREKNLDIDYTIDPDIPSSLIGDCKRLKQIIVNLLSNSVKFTYKGKISLKVSLEKENGICVLKFSVSDTGIGIDATDPAVVDYIFQYFTQIENNNSSDRTGTGLGLAICRSLTELMGGKIWFESKLGEGTTFHFTVQLGIPSHIVESEEKRNSPYFVSKKILILDESIQVRKQLCDLFLRWKAEPIVCNSEEDSRMYLDLGYKFDVAILSITGNSSLINDLKKSGIKIIGLSNIGEKVEDIFDYHMIKPIKQTKIFTICSRIFNNQNGDKCKTQFIKKISTKGLNILIAEDQKSNQKVIVSMLQKLGVENNADNTVKIVENGLQTVDAVKEKKYDILFLDLLMPYMSGYIASREINKDKVNRPELIVAMTAYVIEGEKEKCIDKYGMDGYVSKPIEMREIEAIIEMVIKNKKK